MFRFRRSSGPLLVLASVLVSPVFAQSPAPTPPMGWNSWDAYGLTINEADYRANTKILAGMRQFGWQYSVIDEGWYMQDPFAAPSKAANTCGMRTGS